MFGNAAFDWRSDSRYNRSREANTALGFPTEQAVHLTRAALWTQGIPSQPTSFPLPAFLDKPSDHWNMEMRHETSQFHGLLPRINSPEYFAHQQLQSSKNVTSQTHVFTTHSIYKRDEFLSFTTHFGHLSEVQNTGSRLWNGEPRYSIRGNSNRMLKCQSGCRPAFVEALVQDNLNPGAGRQPYIIQ